MKNRALLLSGGGFRGAVQIPVIERLIQMHLYDDIYGISVGSINGSMTAQDNFKELKKFWDDMDGLGEFLSLRWYWPFNGLYSMSPLREKLEEYLSLDRIKIPFHAGTVSATDGEYYSLNTNEMIKDSELWDAVQASSCMAGIMIPGTFKYNCKEHIGFDGGYRNIIPIPNEDYRHIDVVSCTPIDRMKMRNIEFNKKNLLSLISRGIEIFEDEVFDKDLLTLAISNCETLTIYAPLEYPGETLEASQEVISWRYKLGEDAFYNPTKLK